VNPIAGLGNIVFAPVDGNTPKHVGHIIKY
jgi:hypothetical protein